MSEYTEQLKKRFKTHYQQVAEFRKEVQNAVTDYLKDTRPNDEIVAVASEKEFRDVLFGNNLTRPFFNEWGIYNGYLINDSLIDCRGNKLLIGISERLPNQEISRLEKMKPTAAFSLFLGLTNHHKDGTKLDKIKVYPYKNIPLECSRNLLAEQIVSFHSGEIQAILD